MSAPPLHRPRRRNRLGILLISLGVLFLTLRLSNLFRNFSVPTGAMAPALRPGDQVFMEGVSYRFSSPKRGDVVVFRTEGIANLKVPGSNFVMRLVGLPGDRLRIAGDRLLLNDETLRLQNEAGDILYQNRAETVHLRLPTSAVEVPQGHFFVLGDNSGNSYDSRYWGFVPESNVLGRVTLRYWPPQRIGTVK